MKFTQNLVWGSPLGKQQLGKLKHRWEDNIKMDLMNYM
jgi:hypothetical protein